MSNWETQNECAQSLAIPTTNFRQDNLTERRRVISAPDRSKSDALFVRYVHSRPLRVTDLERSILDSLAAPARVGGLEGVYDALSAALPRLDRVPSGRGGVETHRALLFIRALGRPEWESLPRPEPKSCSPRVPGCGPRS